MKENLLDYPVTGSELQNWPLVHGSFTLYKHHQLIRKEGLLAPSQSKIRLNTRDEDILLGREKYVFIAPLRFKNGYGEDSFILIDPVVLSKPGVRCALYDIFLLIRDIKNVACGFHSPQPFHSWVSDPERLMELIKSVMKKVEASEPRNGVEDDLFQEIVGSQTIKRFLLSQAFSRFWSKYEPDRDQFFSTIADECTKMGMTLRGYAVRDYLWNMSEEIMIPERIEPEYLLGYWDGHTWESWSNSEQPGLSARVWACVDFLKQP